MSVLYTMLSQLEIVKEMNQSYTNIIYFLRVQNKHTVFASSDRLKPFFHPLWKTI